MNIELDRDLVADLLIFLEQAASEPRPADLLRRFKTALQASRRGFTPEPPDEKMYENAPPPDTPANSRG